MGAWRSSLESKGRKKLAAAVASPDDHPELFSEGWSETLEREKVVEAQRAGIFVNGHSGRFLYTYSCINQNLTDAIDAEPAPPNGTALDE